MFIICLCAVLILIMSGCSIKNRLGSNNPLINDIASQNLDLGSDIEEQYKKTCGFMDLGGLFMWHKCL